MIGRAAEKLKRFGIPFERDACVRDRSSFRIGGTAALSVFPSDREQLASAIGILDEANIKTEVIGNASNILFAFDRYNGALVFTGGVSNFAIHGNTIECDAGVSLTYLANIAAKNSLTGLEFAYGIPGLLGGAVYMNAGAYGSQISDVIEYTVTYDRKKQKIERIYDGNFGYRESVYMDNSDLVCLGASLVLGTGKEDEIKGRMTHNMTSRREKQPLEYPSAGSYFKRPEGHFAGKLIEDCGLKGFSLGRVAVSQKHAGFIINLGGADWREVLDIEEKVKERVADTFGILLEREVRVITD